MEGIYFLAQLLILLFAVVIHEVSHGAVAYHLGDPTAKESGRLTLNPIKHLDFWGSFIVPLTLFFISQGKAVFGWAKPVPVNPLLLKNPKRDIGLVAFAGPAANLALAIIFGIFLRIFSPLNPSLTLFFSWIVYINLLLAIFNLVPIPPLDGSKILFSLAPASWAPFLSFLEVYGPIILIIFLFFGFPLIWPVINFLFHLLTGI